MLRNGANKGMTTKYVEKPHIAAVQLGKFHKDMEMPKAIVRVIFLGNQYLPTIETISQLGNDQVNGTLRVADLRIC
jgi:hypothetical protein